MYQYKEQTWWTSPIKWDKNISASVKLSVNRKRRRNLVITNTNSYMLERKLYNNMAAYILILRWTHDNLKRVASNSCKSLQWHTYLYVQQSHGSLLFKKSNYLLFRLNINFAITVELELRNHWSVITCAPYTTARTSYWINNTGQSIPY